MDDDETVEYYEEYGYTAPTYGYLSFPDTLTIQVCPLGVYCLYLSVCLCHR